METFRFHGAEDCYFEPRRYSAGGGLALLIQSFLKGPMAMITVNLEGGFGDGTHAFLDTNNVPDAQFLVERLGIGEDTGIRQRSGYCKYPLYFFDPGKLEKYCADE